MPFVVGLTGGIGTGKTTVANLFAELGAGVVDTDEIARELTAAGQPAVNSIAQRFGRDYVTAEGTLDRARMRRLVFSDAQAKRDLEAILHPLIKQESIRRATASSAAYVLLVVPLLIESGAYRTLVKRVLVVDCAPDRQIERVMQRSRLSHDEVAAIIASQAPRAERLRSADDIIDNDDDVSSLGTQVATLHHKYLGLAAGVNA